MKVLHFVTHSLPLVNGYSLRTKYLLEFQQQLDYHPVVVTRPGFADERVTTLEFCENVGNILHFHFTEKDYPLVGLAKKLPHARDFIRRRLSLRYYSRVIHQCAPCDFFHVHMHPEQLRYLLPLKRQYKIPLVYEIRGVWEDTAVANRRLQPDSKKYKNMRHASTQAAKNADWVITISECLRQDFISRSIPSDKITVVPNGVDTSLFKPLARDRSIAEKLDLGGKIVLGYISSIRELEGIEYLIRVMPAVLSTVPNSACLIVGDGDDRSRLKSLVETLGLKDRVIFTGKVPHDDIRAYYSIIDVFVIPRLNKRVNNLVTPLKPLEAMAMEKALLVSGVGGLTELVQDGKTGLVFEPENAYDLVKKAILLAQNENLRVQLGKQARRFAVQERDWKTVIHKYPEVYKNS